VMKFVSDLRQVGGFLHPYNGNIVESGVKHHNPNHNPIIFTVPVFYFRRF
jgi:hypothetical protein